jgi:imidazole glycerol-phosphate synthase subunit HisH
MSAHPNTIAIVDYGAGNLHSGLKAFERAAKSCAAPPHILVTDDPDVVRKADRIVLPGVGAFADCRKGLDAVDGMTDALFEAVKIKGKPFLGICVGMQLLATRGLEYKTTAGLDWISGDVTLIEPNDPGYKIPHMGWNNIHPQCEHPLMADMELGAFGWHAYFVHSYALVPTTITDAIAVTDYGGPLTAIVAKDNIAGTQFHPEKSQKLGLKLIENFLKWKP